MRREERAKRICRDCLVIRTCRAYALSAPEGYGIWGAMTPRERAHLLNSRHPADGENHAGAFSSDP